MIAFPEPKEITPKMIEEWLGEVFVQTFNLSPQDREGLGDRLHVGQINLVIPGETHVVLETVRTTVQDSAREVINGMMQAAEEGWEFLGFDVGYHQKRRFDGIEVMVKSFFLSEEQS
jgi:hypothetical protein